jgi:hypothetical protein
MRKWHVAVVFLALFAVSDMTAGGIQAKAEEAPAYGEESPGYGEEGPGYGEESPGYGQETAGYGKEDERLVEQTPVVALPAAQSPTTTATDQPRTLDELIMWYDSSSCQECHPKIYKAWASSHHARSLMGINDLIFLRPVLKKGVQAVKNPKHASKRNFTCFKCHLPQALNASDAVFAQITQAIFANDKKTLQKLNISCLVCHNEMAIIHKLQDGKPEAGVVYGTNDVRKHKAELYNTVKKSAIMKRSIMCGQCHGLGPNLEFDNPVQCATLYGSYLHAYIPGGGSETCQECHMQNDDHSCPPDFNRKKETSAWLAKAIALEVETQGYQFISSNNKYTPTAAVNTTITSEAGHRVPDG